MSVGAVATVAVGYLKGAGSKCRWSLVMMVSVLLSLVAYWLAVSHGERSAEAVPAPGTTD